MTVLDQFEDQPIGVAGDWHGDTNFALLVLETFQLNGVKCILHLGDFGIFNSEQGQRYLDALDEALRASESFIFVTPGNHEDYNLLGALRPNEDGLLPLREHIYAFPRGYRWIWDGQTFMSVGGAASIDFERRTVNIDWWPQEALTEGDFYRATDKGRVNVLLTHDCPTGVKIPGLWEGWSAEGLAYSHKNQDALRAIVDAVMPDVIFHGHFHTAYSTSFMLGNDHEVSVVGLSDNTVGSVKGNIMAFTLQQ